MWVLVDSFTISEILPKQSGVRAATINSSLSHKEVKEVEQKILNNSLDLLYVSPVRFFVEGFLNHLKKSKDSVARFIIKDGNGWGDIFGV